jgi:hypothetical protein
MKLATAVKLRLGEILGIKDDPKDDPLVCRLSHNLNEGQVITIDTVECKGRGVISRILSSHRTPTRQTSGTACLLSLKIKRFKERTDRLENL